MWSTLRRWLGRAAGAHPRLASSAAWSQTDHQQLQERLERLGPFPAPDTTPLCKRPVVVFDLETTGLDRRRDTVLSVGAVRIEALGIVLGQSFDRVLNVQVALPRTSQLFHGLTRTDLARGEDPRHVLIDLLEWGQDAVWLAWHAWFDQAMLHRAAQQWLGLSAEQSERLPRVLDLAHAMPMLFPQHAALGADLDAWLQTMRLGHSARHHAAADAMATAELALVALANAQSQGFTDWRQLGDAMARSQKHLEQQQVAQHGGF